MNNESPQLEQGYTKIANQILESLSRINLSAYQARVIHFILRKTYGFGKKEDWISGSQIVEGTGIKKSHVSRTKKELLLRKLVTSLGNKIGFQKDHSLWQELPVQATIKRVKKVTSTGLKVTSTGQELPVQGHTKETIQKKYNTMGNPIDLKKLEEQKQGLVKKLSIGISTKHQAQAFDYFNRLKIDTKKITDRSLIGRWIKLFKTGNQARIQNTLSFLVDQPKLSEKSPDEKIKLFFWCYNNK